MNHGNGFFYLAEIGYFRLAQNGCFRPALTVIKQTLRAALEPAEGVAENAAGGWSVGKAFPSFFIFLYILFSLQII